MLCQVTCIMLIKKILQLAVVSSESSFKKQCLYFLLLINYQVSKAELFVKKINYFGQLLLLTNRLHIIGKRYGVCGAVQESRLDPAPRLVWSVWGLRCESGSVLVDLCSRPPIMEGQDVNSPYRTFRRVGCKFFNTMCRPCQHNKSFTKLKHGPPDIQQLDSIFVG